MSDSDNFSNNLSNNLYDVIVVGSGPAGVFAARELREKRVLVLDVGYTAKPACLPKENIYSLKKNATESVDDLLLGEQFESLENIKGGTLSPKLKAPLMRFITQRPEAFQKHRGFGFEAVTSFAKGGLANAWGAGVLRFTAADLKGFPIGLQDLRPWYDELSDHIGISGTNDDLVPWLGESSTLQPPIELNPLVQKFFTKYQNHRATINARSVTVGRARAAILTKDLGSRQAYDYFGQDFFQPNISAIYHPGYTLDELVEKKCVEYRQNILVESYLEEENQVSVTGQNLLTGQKETFLAKKLCLAAGTLNTSKIVLASNNDYTTKLPILDNPVSFVPLVDLTRIGKSIAVNTCLGGGLIAIYHGKLAPEPVQASVYGLMAPLRSDLLLEMPLAIQGNLKAGKYLLPALAMLQIFYPDDPSPENFIQLQDSGEGGHLNIHYQSKQRGLLERQFLHAIRPTGFLGASFLSKFPIAGSSIHYAGSLPMRDTPRSRYETDRFGRLFGTKRIHVMDAATFPRLPSKNLTFTIMANAMRIAQAIKTEL